VTAPQTAASHRAPHRAGPATYRITLPAGLPLLNANGRQHHHDKRRITARLRNAAMEAVADCGPLMAAVVGLGDRPALERAHILGVVHPATRRRIDPANLYPSFKAAVDGLVDAGVLPDDDADHVLGPDMRRGPVVRGGQLVLVVRALTARQFDRLAAGVMPV
jgi:crossover junction endodeoxyribonuclease RusA